MKLLILGAGPCGLGAAWRLHELGRSDWSIFEKSSQVGGLAASFRSLNGYTWDVGGHVLFSHYDYFDDVLAQIMPLPEDWVLHERESWIRIQDRWVPYPFQMNIRHLGPESFLACIKGLIKLYKAPRNAPPENFAEWIDAAFGEGLAKTFMRPYNWKVWGYPLDRMPWNWVGERVPTVDLERIIENYVYKRDDISWGPNRKFRFPALGGTGAIWRTLAQSLPGMRIHLDEECVRMDLGAQKAYFGSGVCEDFDLMLSTITLPKLCELSNILSSFPGIARLGISSTHVVGVGIRGHAPEEMRTKCWMYFPEDNCPFYRVTHFSHYSPNNVPDINRYWSLMAEVSETSFKPVDKERLVEDVIQGMINAGLINDRSVIDTVWCRLFFDTYPVPTLDRDEILAPVQEHLEAHGVFSRGRMGAWKYEVGNMDHSFMQGKEWVDRVILGQEEITVDHPHLVNRPKE